MAGSTHCIPPSPTMKPSAPPTRFPKNKVRILLLENVHKRAIDMFHQEGFYVETATALSKEELLDKLAGRNGHEAIHAIGVRSKTVLSAECFELAKRLLCVGCYCIGTDNHDLPKAEQCGIPVFNAPFANTRSVAELVITEIIALSRQLMDRSAECHRGGWYKARRFRDASETPLARCPFRDTPSERSSRFRQPPGPFGLREIRAEIAISPSAGVQGVLRGARQDARHRRVRARRLAGLGQPSATPRPPLGNTSATPRPHLAGLRAGRVAWHARCLPRREI